MSDLRAFGPFVGIPDELIKSAGFSCGLCHKPVERFAATVPGGVLRMIFHACRCGTVVTWEDETQVRCKDWRPLVRLLQKSGAKAVMFDGNKPLSEGFSGLN
jgi:hypothetical protein